MPNKYEISGTALFIGKVMQDMKKMKAELNEHRYCLERNVEQRTENLLKRIALLESCNATLSGKLALAHRELAALKRQPVHVSPARAAEPNDRIAKLYVMGAQAQKPMAPGMLGKWDEHATAA